MGSFPHELPGYRPVQDDAIRGAFEKHWGVKIDPEPGYRIPNMFDAAIAGDYKGMYIQGEDLAQSDPNTLHVEAARGKGLFVETDYVPTEERTDRKFPLILTTGRTLSQYNVGAQTRRTENIVWYHEDLLEIHPHDAELRGISEGDRVSLASRKGDITLSAKITERVQPGVVYTTFHDPETGANVVTTEYSDWATNCPEYKVTAVQITPAEHRSKWQSQFDARAKEQGKILATT